MALTDQQMQTLQGQIKQYCKNDAPTKYIDDRTGQGYQIILKTDSTTQAIAVAPIKYDANGEEYVDYSETAIAVAGTQPIADGLKLSLDKIFSLEWQSKKFDRISSSVNAATAMVGMMAQYNDINRFYNETQHIIETHKGAKISNMSGFSQSGAPVAKVAAENGVERVTNFMDWAAYAAAHKGGSYRPEYSPDKEFYPEEAHITEKEKEYLAKHAHIYSDYGKEVTNADGGGGVIPYGKVFTVEGAEHSPSFPKIRENGPDYEYYAKEGKFATGMNERQVYQAALHKVKAGEYKHDVSYYIKEYKDKYGSYAKIVSYTQDITANHQKLENLRGQLSTATGAGLIFVRKELVKLAVDTAYLQTAEFENAFFQKMKEMKLKIQAENRLATEGAYAIAYELNGFEVDSLLEDISFRKMWDEAKELVCMEELTQFSITFNSDAEKLMEAANKLEETDKKGANLFAKSE